MGWVQVAQREVEVDLVGQVEGWVQLNESKKEISTSMRNDNGNTRICNGVGDARFDTRHKLSRNR